MGKICNLSDKVFMIPNMSYCKFIDMNTQKKKCKGHKEVVKYTINTNHY